jgi:CheY-like chemotaxis protein
VKKKILVVDDDPSQRFTIKEVLQSSGDFQVIDAENGQKCLELLKNNQIPDLILLDIMMPQMSGWNVFNQLKENTLWKNIPIIFLTARTDETARKAGQFLGEDFIEKPYDRTDLISRINKAVAVAKQKQSPEKIQKQP